MKYIKVDTIYISVFLLFYVFVLFLGCSKFSPLYDFNYWADINIYFNIGKGIWSDKVAYKDLFDHKGPIIFFIYSIGYLISHTTFLGMFFVQVLFQFVALYFSYLSIKLFVNQRLAILLSLLVPLFLLVFSQDGGSAEEFIYVFQIISLYFILKYFKKNESVSPLYSMLIHGICLSTVFFIKLNLIVFWFFPVLIIFIDILIKRGSKYLLYSIIGLFSGISLVTLLLVFYFYYHKALGDLWSGYFEFNFLYGELHISSIKDFILGIIAQIYRTTLSYYIVLPLIFLGILFFTFSSVFKSILGRLALSLSALFLIVIIVTTRVLLTYYLISFSVFSVLTCIMIGVIIEKYLKWYGKNKYGYYILFFIICIVFGVYQKNFFGYSLSTLYSRQFSLTEVEVFENEIKKEADPTLLVAGFKKGLPIFTKMDILPNTKYFFFPNIHHEVFPALRDGQTKYILNQDVDFIVIYERFRYYNYYKEIIEKHYKVGRTFESKDVGIVFLYERM